MNRIWHRVAKYLIITATVQALLGIMLSATMYGRGPISLLFLIPMANIAYPLLLQNAINLRLWPTAILIGTVFMLLVILTVGEGVNWLKNRYTES